MADVFKTPGVYIKEIPTFPPSVAEVETAIPAFIGYTEKATFNGKSLILEPTRIASLLEYEQLFGYAQKEKSITVTIADVTATGSRTISVTRAPEAGSHFRLYYGLQMYFANGGGPCYIVSVGNYPDGAASDTNVSLEGLAAGLTAIASVDEPTLLVFPDATALNASNYYGLINQALSQCFLLHRFTIIDVKQVTGTPNDINASADTFRNTATLGSNLDLMKYGGAYFPYLETTLSYRFDDADINVVYSIDGTVETNETVGSPDNLSLASILAPQNGVKASIRSGLNLQKPTPTVPASPIESPEVTGNTELYNLLKLELQKLTVTMPPSSAVAGVYAAVDSSREPNDANTWVRVRAMIENFLVKQWRAGALAGAKPEHAFFVRVGLGQTMTALDILEGRMNIEIGMAVVRPAEFIILKFSHKLQES
jgi:phage tail sheath protein FI